MFSFIVSNSNSIFYTCRTYVYIYISDLLGYDIAMLSQQPYPNPLYTVLLCNPIYNRETRIIRFMQMERELKRVGQHSIDCTQIVLGYISQSVVSSHPAKLIPTIELGELYTSNTR